MNDIITVDSSTSTDLTTGTLPEGWKQAKWEDVLAPGKESFRRGPFGSALKKSIFVEEGYKVYEQSNAINDDCSLGRYRISDDKFKELATFAVASRDFLISCSGTIGRMTQIPEEFEEGVINQALLRVRIDYEQMSDNFFRILFESPIIQRQILQNSTGTAMSNVKGVKELKAISVPVPPLAEQERIVEILEEQLSRLDAALESVRVVREKAAQFRRSLLHAAFTGALTGHDPTPGALPDGWEFYSLGELVKTSYGKGLEKSLRLESGPVPVVGSAGLMAYTQEPLVVGETIVVGRKGNIGEVQYFADGVWPIDTVYYFEVPPSLKAKYFFFILKSKEMRRLDSSTSTPSLRREDMERVLIEIPPLAEQERIVEILEEQLSRLDAALASADVIEKRSAALRRSLLHAAFTGKLTEQWREQHYV